MNCPLNLISGFATLDGKDCSQVFALTVNEPFTSLWKTFFQPLWIYSAIVGVSIMTQLQNWILSVRTLARPAAGPEEAWAYIRFWIASRSSHQTIMLVWCFSEILSHISGHAPPTILAITLKSWKSLFLFFFFFGKLWMETVFLSAVVSF